MGISYLSCLNLIRIQKACCLLSEGAPSVLNTALNCGFTSIRTFNRVFRQFTGLTPTEFIALPDSSRYTIRYPKASGANLGWFANDSSMMIHYKKNESRPLEEPTAP